MDKLEKIALAGGCFWGVEEYFSHLQGVEKTEVGYSNGNTQHTDYHQLSTTNHVEVVFLSYDSDSISLSFLLEQYYKIIDPTSYHQQGNDKGAQYRTGIYYTTENQKRIAEASLAHLAQKIQQKVLVELAPLTNYVKGEEYHQGYLKQNPQGYCHLGKAHFSQAKEEKDVFCLYPKYQGTLSPLSYEITQKNGTEPAFSHPYWEEDRPGIYLDITTGQPLFSSKDKFESSCGWPSFSAPMREELLQEKLDTTHGIERIEIRSEKGNSHLGHLFYDRPKGDHRRYCINGGALFFIPLEEMEEKGYKNLIPYVI